MRMFFSFSLHFSNLPCFFLLCSFFLILALGGRWGPYEALLLSFALNPQPLVLGGGHCLAPAGPQAIGGERRGQSPAGRGRRSRAAQRSMGPEPVLGVGGDRPRGCPWRNRRSHVCVRVQRYWGRCECAGSVAKGLGRGPLNGERQLPHDRPSVFLQGSVSGRCRPRGQEGLQEMSGRPEAAWEVAGAAAAFAGAGSD